MLARYLLSTITTKFGHLFEDFDTNNTTAELSAWRGVVVLRNLHLKKDALKHLGVPLANNCDVDDDGENIIDGNIDNIEATCSNNRSDSDDDSFRSCTSQIIDDVDGINCQANDNQDRLPQNRNVPTIEVTHGYIGSLELHIPWKLLRSSASYSENDANSTEDLSATKQQIQDDSSLKCSAVLSDVRILLAPNNHTRNQSNKSDGCSSNTNRQAEDKSSPTSSKEKELRELERIQRERELAVQSLIEKEILRRVRGVNGDNIDENKSDDISSNRASDAKEGRLARWAKGLVARILSSLTVTVQNIHIRYEDEGYGWFEDTSTQSKRHQYRPSFAVGIRLGSFSIRSANANEDAPTTPSLDDNKRSSSPHTGIHLLQHKVANVDKLSVYWDSSHPDLFVGYASKENDRDYYDKRFAELDIMCTNDFEGDTLQHTYLVHPISPSLHLMTFSSNGESSSQQSNNDTQSSAATSIHATLCLPSCHIGFDRNVLEDIAYVRKCLSAYKVRIVSSKEKLIEQRISQQLLDIKPPPDIRPSDDPRLWWKYAIEAVRTLQSDRSYFEGKSNTRQRRWRRDGWLGLARLVRLRREYTSLYYSLWSSSQNDIESKKKIHMELLALEDMLNEEEIAAFRMTGFLSYASSQLDEAKSIDSDTPQNRAIEKADSLDVDQLASGNVSVLSLQYRERQLNQIVQSIKSDQVESNPIEDNQKSNAIYQDIQHYDTDTPILTISLSCKNFILQANDTSHSSNNIVHQQFQRQQVIPIARLHCLSSLRFDKFSNGSWDLSCAMNSLVVSDLMNNEGQTIVGEKESSSWDDDAESTNLEHEHTARITIRNVISSHESLQSQSTTTYCDINVSPLQAIYSTNVYEALSRLFTSMKTDEFNRDYTRITNALSRWRSRTGKRLMSVLSRRKKFVVSVNIAAPVLLIPQDLKDINSPTLVIDLGQLSFYSDSSGDSLPSGFDDKWLLQLNNIQALCIQQQSQHAIIEPFSLEVSILTHIADSGIETDDINKVKVNVLLPQLCFNFTSSATRLLSRLEMKWNTVRKHKTYQQSQKQHTLNDILFDNNRRLQQLQKTKHGFFDEGTPLASNIITSNAVVSQEVKFSFAAPSITLSIMNDIGLDQTIISNPIPLINLTIYGIHGEHTSIQDSEGKSAKLSAHLQSIHITDCTKIGSHYCHLLSSIDPALLEDIDNPIQNIDMSDDEDLVNIEMASNPNGDKMITVHLQHLYVEWNPELLATMHKDLRLPQTEMEVDGEGPQAVDTDNSEFFDALDVVTTDSYDTVEEEGAEEIPIDVVDSTYQAASPVITPSSQLKVVLHLSKLCINFNKDSRSRCLFGAEMNETNISFSSKRLGGSVTTTTVANARLKDTDGFSGLSLYGQMIGLQSSLSSSHQSSLVHMSFETFPNDSTSEFHNVMKLEFTKMRFVYLHQWWLEVFDYFFEGILGHAVWGTKPKYQFNPSEATRPFKRTKMYINMDQPLLLLPMCCRSPHHIRLKMNSLNVSSLGFIQEQVHKEEGELNSWFQWFHKVKVLMSGVDISSWDERQLTNLDEEGPPPSLTFNIQWPVGPTATLIKPKWNVEGKVDPLIFSLSQKDFSLFRFFVNYNLLGPSRFLSIPEDSSQCCHTPTRLVLFGYEKINAPPTTYSIKLSCDLLQFKFLLDAEESVSRKVEGIMNVSCAQAFWSLVKLADCITKTKVNVESIRLTQTSKKKWKGFPDLLLPLPSSGNSDDSSVMSRPHCLLQFTSTTHPNGNNMKTLHLDAAGIYMIMPAWRHVGTFFNNLPTSPEEFSLEEMSSIMQIGDRFYRMSKGTTTVEASQRNDTIPNEANDATSYQTVSSKEFLLTLITPRIILVEDAATDECQCLTLSMYHLNFLRQTNAHEEVNTLFCDGLEIFTGMANNHSSPGSSLLYPLSMSGSLKKILPSRDCSTQSLSGWVWAEELQARAAYTDLTHSINVFIGVEKQMAMLKDSTSQYNTRITQPEKKEERNRINVEVLCNGFNLVVTDDSHRHFANAQPLVSVSLTGIRVSRIANNPQENQALNEGIRLVENTFISLDGVDIIDLLRQSDSPFRVMTTSSQQEQVAKHEGLFSFVSRIELDAMSWETHRLLVSNEWGFEISASFEKHSDAISQLTPPSSYFDGSLGQQNQHFVAFNSALYDNGLHSIDVNVCHLTCQYNPSTIIAIQRFLGRLKKAAHSFLNKQPDTTSIHNTSSTDTIEQPPPKQSPDQSSITFSIHANIGSICLCLNKEYQQRRLLDGFVSGIKINFEYKEQSLMLEGSIENFRVWDPDMSKTTSDRNRHLIRLIDCDRNGEDDETNFFSFRYRTFKTLHTRQNEHESLPDWIEKKITSGDIDDYLTAKIRPLEFIYLRERTAEIADYLNNGLPGKGMGATSQAAQSFVSSRIRSRSFLDLVIAEPRVYIPCSSSSIVGGCYLSFGTLSLQSWFEEALVHLDYLDNKSFEDDEKSDKMDWIRVLDLNLDVGIKVEVDGPISTEEMTSNPDTYFHTNLTIRKPSEGDITIVRARIPSLNTNLKYRSFIMLNLIANENVGKSIDESKWDNIEKSYWQTDQEERQASNNISEEQALVYAETARLVHFGKAKSTKPKKDGTHCQFLIDSITITLHRDDWRENLDEEKATLLCYDICEFSIKDLKMVLTKEANGNQTISVALSDFHVKDVGDYGRLAREIYLGSGTSRPPCAFSVVAEGYGKTSTTTAAAVEDPLISLTIGTQTLYNTNDEGNVSLDRKQVTKNVNFELKVNSLSITVLPRSIDDVLCFLTKQWLCPNSKYITKPSSKSSKTKYTDVPATSEVDTLTFRFVALYPRLILLADEYDPFSRGLVLRGLTVANMSIVKDRASSTATRYGQADTRSTTELSGHIKDLTTYVHNNIDPIIGSKEDSEDTTVVALIEPVTATFEVEVVSRSRFPTSRSLSLEIEPVATMVSFSDLNLIETVVRKSTRKKSHNESVPLKPESRVQSPANSSHIDTLQAFSRSSDYSMSKEELTFDVAILTKKLGLFLRKSASNIIVERSTNDRIEAGDILLCINGQSVERQSLSTIVKLFETTPRPLNVTLSRVNSEYQSDLLPMQSSDAANATSNSSSFDLSLNSGSGSNDDTDQNATNQAPSQPLYYDLVCKCGLPIGIELLAGIGGTAVVNRVDYKVLAQSLNIDCDDDDLPRMPLPGAVVLAIDEKKFDGKEEVCQQLTSYEESASKDKYYSLSFVEAASSAWGNISTFEGKLGLSLTVIDDTNGRDMPVLRAGINNASFAINHGLAVTTTAINVQPPAILSSTGEGQLQGSNNLVVTMESEVQRFSVEYNNANINHWEHIIEPHCLMARIELQNGIASQPGQSSILICDNNNQSSDLSPIDFICINVSDSAVDMLSKSAMNWREWKKAKAQIPSEETGSPMSSTPTHVSPSPVFQRGSSASTSSAADLKRATKLAKNLLNFSRRRGKTHTDTDSKASPFVFRNRLGVQVSFSSHGVDSTVVEDGQDYQFQMRLANNIDKQTDGMIRRYDGQFPKIDVELEFVNSPRGSVDIPDVAADPIISLPTGKVGNSVRSINVWKKKEIITQVSQKVTVIWSVTLDQGRRILTLHSASCINVFGCGPAFEIGVCLSDGQDEGITNKREMIPIGTTSKDEVFYLPLWIETSFCRVDVFVRPFTRDGSTGVYRWSTFPVICLKEIGWNADATEVSYSWVTKKSVSSLEGVSCPLKTTTTNESGYHPFWLKCSCSKESLKYETLDDNKARIALSSDAESDGQLNYQAFKTSVTIWSAITIRNMLPCNVEWEVAQSDEQESKSVFDSSLKRTDQNTTANDSLQCGGAVEIYTPDARDCQVYARFKCIVRDGCYWSEWLCINLVDGTMKRDGDEYAPELKQVNIKCNDGSCDNPLTIGVKLSPHDGEGFNVLLYAEIWLRNLTTLPLTFGAPSLQLGLDEGMIESALPGKVSADSALLELTNVLEGNSIFGNDDVGDDDIGDDVFNLPLQQCEEIYEEVFEYVSLNSMGKVEHKWWASENHVSRRQEPKGTNWTLDVAGEPFLQDGWESCVNIVGQRSSTFNGRRVFNNNHRFRRRRWFRKISGHIGNHILNKLIFHQPEDLDIYTRSKREAERNSIGAVIKEDGPNLLDLFNGSQQESVLDIMTTVANDGSILIYVKYKDGKWSTPAIIPPSGAATGCIRLSSSRWPQVTKAKRHSSEYSTWQSTSDTSESKLGIAPLEPTVFELIYRVTVLKGLWGELSRMVTITPRFMIRNESTWLDIDVKQTGAPDSTRTLIKKGEVVPFYWYDGSLPELVSARPAQSRNRFKWSGGFDVCTLGMLPIRIRRIDGSIDQSNLRSMRVNVELQPSTGGSGTIISLRDEHPQGEGSLFRIENHTPFPIFVAQDGVLANPFQNDSSTSQCDVIQPHEYTSYALDVPWRQGKYTGRSSASTAELLLLRCALAPLSTREGVESTKVVCFEKVGHYIRLSPSKLSLLIGSAVATELLGVRVLGIVGEDGPTRTLRFVLMNKEISSTSYIGNAVRETIHPMHSFSMSAESKPQHNEDITDRSKLLQNAARYTSQLLQDGSLLNEREATKQAFFGTGVCKRIVDKKVTVHSQEDSDHVGNEIQLELKVSGIIFSIIDSSPSEIAVLSLHDLQVGASWNSLGTEYAKSRVVVGWCQLDNHCPGSSYPVALRPKVKPNDHATSKNDIDQDVKKAFTADKPFLEVVVDIAPAHRTGIQSLTGGVSLHDVEIYVDIAFILRIQHYLLGIQDHIHDATGIRTHKFVDSQDNWGLPSNIEQLLKQKSGKTISHQSMYFQRLTILPCKVKLSVAPVRALTKYQEQFEGQEASAIHAAVRKGDLLVGEGSAGGLGVKIGSKNRTAMSVVQGMMKSILVDALLRLDGASLNFEGVALFNHTSNSPQLLTYLGAHYLASLIANVPSLIGSLAALGNPVGLVKNLGDGVSDFINEPVQGFKRSLEEMNPSFALDGVARGTGSLARHTVGGFADSAALLTSTAAKNMAVLTLDRKYAQRRDKVIKLKAHDTKSANLLNGLQSGFSKLVSGILEGVTGVVSKPIKGAERSGIEGFAKGVGKGLLGLIVKPGIGVTDLITDTLIGVKGSVEGTASDMLISYSQVRPRRALYGDDRLVKPYRIDDATAAVIQSKLCLGGENYLDHVDMNSSVALMSVYKLFILSSDGEELLLLPFNEIRKVEVQPKENTEAFFVNIYLNDLKKDGSEVVEKVDCDDETMANLLCEKLTEAIQQTKI